MTRVPLLIQSGVLSRPSALALRLSGLASAASAQGVRVSPQDRRTLTSSLTKTGPSPYGFAQSKLPLERVDGQRELPPRCDPHRSEKGIAQRALPGERERKTSSQFPGLRLEGSTRCPDRGIDGSPGGVDVDSISLVHSGRGPFMSPLLTEILPMTNVLLGALRA